VFEDDLHFSSDSRYFMKDVEWLSNEVDVIKLETMLTKVKIEMKGTADGSRSIHRLLSNHWGAGAYILSRGLARRLVKETRYFSDQPDVVLFRQPSAIRAYQLVPAICIQDLYLRGGNSDGYLGSTLEAERIPLRHLPKPQGWAKVRREAGRPILRLGHAAWDVLQPLFGRKSIRIPMRW
jgi:glycosyl transferase family 25